MDVVNERANCCIFTPVFIQRSMAIMLNMYCLKVFHVAGSKSLKKFLFAKSIFGRYLNINTLLFMLQ